MVETMHFRMNDSRACRVAVVTCFVFYFSAKIKTYLFLCERLRAIRQNQVSRCADLAWQRCFIGVVMIFAEIVLLCFSYPIHTVEKGYCQIGLPTWLIGTVLAFDICCNLVISTLFWRFSPRLFEGFWDAVLSLNMRRMLRVHHVKMENGDTGIIIPARSNPADVPLEKRLMSYIIRKTFLISVVILASTVINLSLLVHYHGREFGWQFFLMCKLCPFFCSCPRSNPIPKALSTSHGTYYASHTLLACRLNAKLSSLISTRTNSQTTRHLRIM